MNSLIAEALWKNIPGFDGYQAHPEGELRSTKTERLLMAETKKHRYRQVTIFGKSVCLHRLVALTFCPNPLNLPQVNHKDGNKRNNKSENLEWTSAADNVKHAIARGRIVSKNRSNPVRVTMKDGTIFEYDSSADAAKELKLSAEIISHCLRTDGLYCGVQGLLNKEDRWLFKIERINVVANDDTNKIDEGHVTTKEITIDGYQHLVASSDGTLMNKYTKKNVVGSKQDGRYARVKSTIKEDGTNSSMAIHRLIAMVFIENPEGKDTVNHKDGCTTNNCVANLEWMSQKENVQDAIKTGLVNEETRKSRSNNHKVPVYQLGLDDTILARYDSGADASESVGTNISSACYSYRKEMRGGKSRAKITQGYRWCFVADYSEPKENKTLTDMDASGGGSL